MMGAFGIILCIAAYIVVAAALQEIAKRQKQKNSWLAWIPVANLALILQMGGFHWALVFLCLIPVVGLVLQIVALWRIFEKEKYPGILALIGVLIAPVLVIFLALIAWKK